MHLTYQYPEDLMNFIVDNDIGGNMLCNWIWEGYFHWNCPKLKLYIGGRAQQVYDEKTFAKYLVMMEGKNSAQYLRSNDVHLVVIPNIPEEPINPEASDTPEGQPKKPESMTPEQSFKAMGNWECVYKDAMYVLMADSEDPVTGEIVEKWKSEKLIYRDYGTSRISRKKE